MTSGVPRMRAHLILSLLLLGACGGSKDAISSGGAAEPQMAARPDR